MSIITQSIGSAGGRDFSTIEAWFAAIPTDVIASGNSYVGELYKDSEFLVTGNSLQLSGKTCDATHNITLKTAAGQSYRDNTNVLTNALRFNASNGVAIRKTSSYGPVINLTQPYMLLQGIQAQHTGGGGDKLALNIDSATALVEGCIFQTGGVTTYFAPVIAMRGTFRNCTVINHLDGKSAVHGFYGNGAVWENCTFITPSNVNNGQTVYTGTPGAVTLINCAAFGFGGGFGTAAIYSGDHNASDKAIAFGTNNQPNLVYADQFESTLLDSMDFRLKATSALINTGTTLSDNTTSANGKTRPVGLAYDIGSWEYYDPNAVTAVAPSVPTAVSAVAGNGFATVTFTPGSNGGSSVLYYTLTASTGQTTQVASSPATFPGLPNGTPVTITVSATNAAGTSPTSAASNSVTPAATAPAAPTITSVAPSNGALSVSFTPGADGGSAITGYTATAIPGGATATGTTTTLTINGLTNGTNYTIAVTATNAIGTSVASAPSAATAPFDNGDRTAVVGGVNELIRGIGTNRTFATINAFATYIQGVNCINENKRIIGEVYEDQTTTGVQLHTLATDANRNVLVRPASSKPLTGYSYNTSGVEIATTGALSIGRGVTVADMRLKTTGSGSLLFNGTGSGTEPNAARIRLLANAVNAVQCVNYAEAEFTDSLIVRNAAVGGPISYIGWRVRQRRNTYALEGAGTATFAASNNWGGAVENCAFYGFTTPIENPDANSCINNYTNLTPTSAVGVTVDTVNPFFVAAGTDYRAGTALRDKGNAGATSVNDNLGQNRGLAPDIGAFEFAPSLPLPQGVVTGFVVDGQSVTVMVTTTGTVDTVKISISPTVPGNGAAGVGPLNMVLGTNTASITIDDMSGGNYAAPVITMTNTGGMTMASGSAAFEIMGVGNLVYDGGGVGIGGGTPPSLPPSLVIISTNSEIMDGKTATISGSCDLKGDATGSLVMYVDPQPSGSALGPFVIPVNSGLWNVIRIASLGKVKYRFEATANSQLTSLTTGEITTLSMVNNVRLPV
jgi:hypothetical protein